MAPSHGAPAPGVLLAALCGGAGAVALLLPGSLPSALPPSRTFTAGAGRAPLAATAKLLAADGVAAVELAAGVAAVAGCGGGQRGAAAACFGVGALAAAGLRLALGAGAAAAPRHSTRGRRGHSPLVARAFEDQFGVQPPLGYFDPLGLSSDGDFDEFYRRREAELKNGRVAMYATMGYIAPEWFRWPGYLSPSQDVTFESVPNGLAALSKVPVEGWLQIIAWCGFYEMIINQPRHPSEPGNYYKGRLAIFHMTKISDPELRKRSLNAELANGRLAMIAITGMMVQDGIVGNTGPDMWFP